MDIEIWLKYICIIVCSFTQISLLGLETIQMKKDGIKEYWEDNFNKFDILSFTFFGIYAILRLADFDDGRRISDNSQLTNKDVFMKVLTAYLILMIVFKINFYM